MEYELINHLGWTLLHFTWQGAIVALLHGAAMRMLQHAAPATRYAAALVSLLALAALPIATFAYLYAGNDGGAYVELAGNASAAAPALAQPAPADSAFGIEPLLPWAVGLWLAGVLFLSLRFALDMSMNRRLVRTAIDELIPDELRALLDDLRQRMGIGQRVRIAVSTLIDSPLVVGWLRPVVLLPVSAVTGLDSTQLRMVLAHELAHVRRLDYLVNLMQILVETLLFYHPAVHWISKTLRHERERCCDDVATAVAGDRIAYARLLAELEEMRHAGQESALAIGIADHMLYDRIQRLVHADIASTSISAPARIPWLPAGMALIAAVLVMQPPLSFDIALFDAIRSPDRTLTRTLALPQRADSVLPELISAESGEVRSDATMIPAASERTPVDAPGDAITQTPAKQAVPAISKPMTPESVSANRERNDRTRAGRSTSPPVSVAEPTPSTTTSVNENIPALADTTPAVETPVYTGGQLIHAVEPEYPRSALRAQREGRVTLAFTITPNGQVSTIDVVDARPRGTFERAAINAVREWRYSPFMENGVPIARQATQTLEFRLTGVTSRDPGARTDDCETRTGTRLCMQRVDGFDVTLKVLDE